jgi:hypothetical protein
MSLFPTRSSLVIAVICVVALVGVFLSGRALQMDTILHARHTLFSLPAAISFIYHGGGGYAALAEVAQTIVKDYPNVTDATLQAAINLTGIDHSKLYYVASDDKGTVDLAVLSLWLFGPHITSLYYGFFVLLGISVGGFWWQFRGEPDALGALAIYLLGLWACTPALAITRELYSFDNARVIGVLAVIPALHIIFSFGRSATPGVVALCVLQSLLLVECLHNRATDVWAFFAIAVMAAIAVIRARSLRPVWPVAVVLCILGLFLGFQRMAYDPAYFSTRGRAHLFWHNAGMGFGLDPYFAEKYKISISDPAMSALVERKAKELGGSALVHQIFGDSPGSTGIAEDVVKYEEVGKAAVIQMARENKLETLKLFLIYKPRLLIRTLLWTAGLYPHDLKQLEILDQIGSIATVEERAAKDIYLRPFRIPSLVGIILLALLDVRPRLQLPLWIMLGCSLIAPWAVYPAIHTLGASLLLITMICQSAALWAFVWAVQAVRRRRSGFAPANAPPKA